MFNAVVKHGSKKLVGAVPSAVIGGFSNLGSSALFGAINNEYKDGPNVPHKALASASASFIGSVAQSIAQPFEIVSRNALKYVPSMSRALGRVGKILGAFSSFALTKTLKPANPNFEKRQ